MPDKRARRGEDGISFKLMFQLALFFVLLAAALSGMVYYYTTMDIAVQDIGEASFTCEEAINRQFGDRIKTQYYDGHSSRYDPDTKNFIVFYRIDAVTENGGPLDLHEYLVKCVVKDLQGYVVEFEFYDHGSAHGA